MSLRSFVRRLLKLVFRLYPFVSGQHSVASRRIVKWACRGVRDAASGRRGVDFIYADLNDAHGRSAYFFGCNDGKIRDVIKRIVAPGDVVLDIGANCGTFSLLAARLVAREGVVHAFEPQPKLAEMMRRSAAENRFRNLTVHEVALSDSDRTGILHTYAGDSGYATLSGQDVPQSWKTMSIPVVDAGKYLAGLGLTCVKLLKIDVEKHEYEVLKAAAEFIRNCPPQYLVFEYHEPGVRFWESRLVRLLAGLGYSRIYEVPKSVFRTRVRHITRGTEPGPKSVNFVAVRETTRDLVFGNR